MTVKQAATDACVCQAVVRAWVASGLLTAYRLGMPGKRGKILIRGDDLAALLATFRVMKERPVSAPTAAKPTKPKFKLRHVRLPPP